MPGTLQAVPSEEYSHADADSSTRPLGAQNRALSVTQATLAHHHHLQQAPPSQPTLPLSPPPIHNPLHIHTLLFTTNPSGIRHQSQHTMSQASLGQPRCFDHRDVHTTKISVNLRSHLCAAWQCRTVQACQRALAWTQQPCCCLLALCAGAVLVARGAVAGPALASLAAMGGGVGAVCVQRHVVQRHSGC